MQTDIIRDIYKPTGARKVEPNGTRIRDLSGKPTYLEYAYPRHVKKLMSEVIHFINSSSHLENIKSAIHAYAMIHVAIAHIHPFWRL
ncbi:MAG: Fic family protein [Cycloclasticus sp.]|nr:Fic family protein [Cycloclasticus sp.]